MSENQTAELTEVLRVRREKLQALIDAGQNPYEKTVYGQTHHSEQIREEYAQLEGKEVCIAGRLMSKRVMGKASFAHLQDGQGKIQL